MAVCKECGALNPDSNKFCSECGQPIVKLDSQAIRDAMSQLEAEFEQDALVNLDRSRLTYICDVCGKVNPIDAKQCLRCGKKRPRTDYINALTKIKNSKELKRAVESMERADRDSAAPAASAQKPVAEAPVAPPAPILVKEEPEESKKEERQELSLYRLNPRNDAPEQNRQIVQPFVIVPYVSQNQPLLQYDPNEVYRYMPYSAEEKRAEAERQTKLMENAAASKAAQEEEIHSYQKKEVEAVLARKKAAQKAEKRAKRPASARVRGWSFLTLVVAVAGILAAFADLIIKDFTYLRYLGGDAGRTIPELFDALSQPSFANGTEIAYFMQALLVVLFLASLALIALQSLIRLVTGRIFKRGFLNVLPPLIAFLFAVGIVVAGLAANAWQFDALVAKAFGWIAAVAVALILLICYAFQGARKKRIRR